MISWVGSVDLCLLSCMGWVSRWGWDASLGSLLIGRRESVGCHFLMLSEMQEVLLFLQGVFKKFFNFQNFQEISDIQVINKNSIIQNV